MAKFTKPVIYRQIPWCAIFGNHDSEIAEDRAEQMRALQNLPYSLAQPGPKDVDGIGNCERLNPNGTRMEGKRADSRQTSSSCTLPMRRGCTSSPCISWIRDHISAKPYPGLTPITIT